MFFSEEMLVCLRNSPLGRFFDSTPDARDRKKISQDGFWCVVCVVVCVSMVLYSMVMYFPCNYLNGCIFLKPFKVLFDGRER